MSLETFYSSLPVREDFSGVADLSNYTPLPGTWCVVIADVKGSTKAIQDGEYKAVNMVGVSVITSILNTVKPLEIPYIFGGDGATLCIPDGLVPPVRDALFTTRYMADVQFGLGLRIGIVPISEINKQGCEVLVARHRVSENYIQAAFAGGGIDYAERIIKDDSIETPFRIETHDDLKNADYSGLECRWDNIPSKRGETISLIVKARADSLEDESRIYREIIRKVQEIYGDDEDSRPIYLEGMRITLNKEKLKYEFKARTCFNGLLGRLRYWLFMRMQILLGRCLMRFNIKTGEVEWGRYKEDAVNNADYRKFDGVLREVLSGNADQRKALTAYLEEMYQKRECVYGIHVSNSALITCLINNRAGDHFHFIDGADGGYAMAAAAMKKQLKELV